MRMQDSQANCGPTAMSNALAALGITRPAAECEKLCKTSATEGTSAKRLLSALRSIETCQPAELREKRQDVAMLKLDKALQYGRPVILCVAENTHWVAAVGALGGRVLVADSADNELVLSKSLEQLTTWWYSGTNYYGIIL